MVFFDALRVKIRDGGTVRNKAVHIALGVRAAVGFADIPPGDRAFGPMAARRSWGFGSSRRPPRPPGRVHSVNRIDGLLAIDGAEFWLRVMAELKNRGVEDALVAVVDGLKGFPDAITAVFPRRRSRPASSI